MKRLLRYWPFAIPIAWLIVLLSVMRPGALEIRHNVAYEFSLLFYDSADLAAYVLRGANASLGRKPGRTDEPTWTEVEELEAQLDGPAPPPYAEKYYLEYPSATLLLFRLGFPTRCEMPAPIADCHQYAIAHFVPRNDDERRIWSEFHTGAVIYVSLMTAALIGLIHVLRRGYEVGQPIGPIWLAVLPGAVYFSLNRFDVLPALLTALSFAALGRKQYTWAGAWLAFAVLLKIYPVLFVPIILRYLGVRHGARWLAGFVAIMLIGVGLSWMILGWEPTVRPVLVQLSRVLEKHSWTLYGRVLPLEMSMQGNFRLFILGMLGLILVVSRPADLAGVLHRCVILLTVFVAMAVFWSPQWVVWFLPLVVPLAARNRWLKWNAALLDITNYFQFPVLFWVLWTQFERDSEGFHPLDWVAEALVYIRAALWFSMIVWVAWCEFRPRRRSSGLESLSSPDVTRRIL